MKPPAPPVPHLCPGLLALARLVRRHVPVGHPDRAHALDLIRETRAGVEALRARESHFRGGSGVRVLEVLRDLAADDALGLHGLEDEAPLSMTVRAWLAAGGRT